MRGDLRDDAGVDEASLIRDAVLLGELQEGAIAVLVGERASDFGGNCAGNGTGHCLGALRSLLLVVSGARGCNGQTMMMMMGDHCLFWMTLPAAHALGCICG